MAITDTSEAPLTRRSAPVALLLILAAGLAGAPAFGAEFEAQVTAGASYIDNVALETVDEDPELIYRLEPSFQISHENSRIVANVDYRLQALRYRDFGEHDVFHHYNAILRADLIPENVFFEIGAQRSQTIRDPEQRIPLSNLLISQNRQDRDEYYASPSFQFALGGSVITHGEYRHTWVDFADDIPVLNTEGNEQREASFSIDNYQQNRGLTWALRYDWEHTEYDDEIIDFEYQQAVAEIGFWAGTNTRFFASAGRESAWDMPLDPALEDSLWEVGFSSKVGESLSAEFAAGERSFGGSWRGSLDLQFRRGSTSLSYAETPTTAGRNPRRSDFNDPESPDDFLGRPGGTQRFVSKLFEWRLNFVFQRSELSFSLFDEDRTDRTLADGTPLDDRSQRGGIASASFRVGARTDLLLRGSFTERKFSEGDTSDLTRASAGLAYRLGARTSLSLEYEYADEENEGDNFRGDYVANIVSLLVTRTFGRNASGFADDTLIRDQYE